MLNRTAHRIGSLITNKTSVSPLLHLRRCRSSVDMGRGALIVLEGCDRSGKTTQCRKIVDGLNKMGIKAKRMAFPDRSTPIGQLIDKYLKMDCDVEDHAVHLLFTANRWELMPCIKSDLESGITLVVDRYAYSGAAFSAAKSKLDLNWCLQPEQGIIKPDAVLYFDISHKEASERGEYGSERYEVVSFQKKVAQNYDKLKTVEWKIIDARKSINEVYSDVKSIVEAVIEDVRDWPITYLDMSIPPPCIMS